MVNSLAADFNRLLYKLDADPGVYSTDYRLLGLDDGLDGTALDDFPIPPDPPPPSTAGL